ncbi:cupin domain-containing protein [Ammoniphilus sp. CFH 90114]|uniref:helix-turn-helix domain-containing protein n=1 Tax=Ammoniphilus sp. CFH 90114 TaxID=2493665 RepID=UPI00100F2B93|nr:cupin domain-containing protein [Ammoniphilus sp. CFH 90114]RXT00372.1 helix-turn-helix domain-containing protein [Ammoniphilus sp. CFH 90114]
MDIGKKVKDLRESKGYSVREMAKLCGLSPSLVSQVERNVSSPSISTLLKMAEILHVPVGSFFSEVEHEKQIVRKRERRKFIYPDHTTTYEFANPPELDRELRTLVVTLQPMQYTSNQKVSHQDKEICFVVAGEVSVEFEDSTHLLQEGDSIVFNSQNPHRFYNKSEREAQFLLIIYK